MKSEICFVFSNIIFMPKVYLLIGSIKISFENKRLIFKCIYLVERKLNFLVNFLKILMYTYFLVEI